MSCIDHGQNRKKYGHIKREGRTYLIHRFIYALSHKVSMDALEGYVVRHTCDNPRCINPQHLILGTTQDNVDDRVARGRSMKGEAHYKAKLTQEDVNEIRALYAEGNTSYTKLAAKYGVDKTNIACIIKHKTWKD